MTLGGPFRTPLKEEVLNFIDSACPRVAIFNEMVSSLAQEVIVFVGSRISFSLARESILRARETY